MASATSTALIPVRAAPLIQIDSYVTLGKLCDFFLHSKRRLIVTGEICALMVGHYEKTVGRLVDCFGYDCPVESLRGVHFTQFRDSFPKTWGAVSRGATVQHTRTIFKFAYDHELIERPMRFGPDFKKPKLLVYRRERRAKGLQMFEAEEIRKLLETMNHRLQKPNYTWPMRAMILLGVNCGFGPSDCGRLCLDNIDLKAGWIDFPRAKTGTDRRIPLWPETVSAIERALHERPMAADQKNNRRVFLTKYGNVWCDGDSSSALTKRFKWLMLRAKVRRLDRGFYGLRRTFRTIADETGDQPACNLMMGHVPPAHDMASAYRQRKQSRHLAGIH